MNKSPVVSIIIPAYNRVDYIDQTILSVLNQTYSNCELIVIDDGSTDGTFEKIKSYSDRLILLTHDGHINKGQSAAINLGLNKARGKYIAVLDSDDYWELTKLEVQSEYLETHSDIGLVYANGYAVDEKGKILYPIYSDNHREMNEPDSVLLDCYIALPVNSLVCKEVYEKVGDFDETFRAAQDHDMLVRIAEVTRFAYLPDYLWCYRQHGNSISSKQQDVRWAAGFTILENARKRYPYKSATIRKRLAVLNYRMGVCALSANRYIKSLKYFISAFLLDPVRALKVTMKYERKG